MKYFTLLVLIFFAPAAWGNNLDSSLFFTPNEMKTIEEALLKNRSAADAKHLLHLGSIIYYGQSDWVLWIQGQKWLPDTKRDDVRIIKVTPEKVKLAVTLPGHTDKKEITLRPHQSFNLLTGQIIEGF